MEDADGDKGLAGELRQRQQQDDVQVVQPSNIAATFDLEAAEAPLQALFTNVSSPGTAIMTWKPATHPVLQPTAICVHVHSCCVPRPPGMPSMADVFANA